MRNTVTPRVFIAATRQNDGKTTTSLGLLSALQPHCGRVGYIKPVGQRFVEIDEQKIDEDSVLMNHIFSLNCPLIDMSPIAVEPDFTRKYLQSSNFDFLVRRIESAFDRVGWEKEFVLCEGTGHAGVGSVFDLSNAAVARILRSKVIIVTQGGIGKPVDEVALNHALFQKEGVDVIGVIVNKVLPEKLDYIKEFVGRGLRRQGLELLGVIPYRRMLSNPTLHLIREDLGTDCLNRSPSACSNESVERVMVGAMSAGHAFDLLRPGVLLITPGDREDLLSAAVAWSRSTGQRLAGIVLSDNSLPHEGLRQDLQSLPCPVLLAKDDSYTVASKVHDLIVKIRPGDNDKISLVRNLIVHHVNLDKILEAVGPKSGSLRAKERREELGAA